MRKHVCPWWFAYTFDNALRRLLHDPVKLLGDYVRPGMTVIDIGCGMGHFSLGMARLVGTSGKVIAVDLQQEMLDTLMRRADRAGVARQITPVLCDEHDIGVSQPVDFALLFWMVHETPDEASLFQQTYEILNTGGKLLYAEPKFHVSRTNFKRTVSIAQTTGFMQIKSLKVCCSYNVLFEKK